MLSFQYIISPQVTKSRLPLMARKRGALRRSNCITPDHAHPLALYPSHRAHEQAGVKVDPTTIGGVKAFIITPREIAKDRGFAFAGAIAPATPWSDMTKSNDIHRETC